MSKKETLPKQKFSSTKVSTIVGVALVLFLVGLMLTGIFGLESIQKQARESLQGDLFFKPEYNSGDIKQVEQELKAWDCFHEISYISPERAIAEFQGEEENASAILDVFEGENPLPPTISFKPKNEFATKQGMKQIKTRILKKYPTMIDEVNYDVSSVDDVNLGFKQIVFVVLLLGIILVMIAVALINNTIRLTLFAQRFTIKTMQLVGAQRRFIRKPFLKKAVFQGCVSAIIGMAMLLTVFFAVNNILDIIQIELSWLQFGFLFAGLLFCGILITFVSTWFALNKYLRTNLDDLY